MNNGRHRTKRVKLPLRAYLLYLLVASFLMTGVTFSKYITASSGGDSARTASIRELGITETGDFAGENHTAYVIPGVSLEKKAEVNFGGSDVATYVFVEIGAEGWTADEAGRTFTVSHNGAELMRWSVDGDWTLLPGSTYVYYRPLAPNTTLSDDIIADGAIAVTEAVTEANIDMTGSSISLRAYAVQSSGFDGPGAAWNSVSGKK